MEKLKSAMVLTVNSIDDKNINPKELASQLKSYKQLLNFTYDHGLRLREHYEKSKKASEIRNEIDILNCIYMGRANEEVNKSIKAKTEYLKEVEKDLDYWKVGFYNTILNHIKYFNELIDKLYTQYENNINQKDFKSAEGVLLCISTLNSTIFPFGYKSNAVKSFNGDNVKATTSNDSIKSTVEDKYKWNDSWEEFAGSVTEYIDATFEFAKNSITK